MSDPNAEPAIGEPDISTLQPSMNGGVAAVPPAPGTESAAGITEDDAVRDEAEGAGL